ncbi:hypothetical protein OBBRIDRAFT_804859 [Obba rivulosa]|uniref:Uncharacterized protein n=1 Tax=Obba rivulosa TaxID=1052685 RepID=A0A8E2AU07_9APHY|nr:hypothetical protein OBBRIDRAFT_804859 [Obba rivulosa]
MRGRKSIHETSSKLQLIYSQNLEVDGALEPIEKKADQRLPQTAKGLQPAAPNVGYGTRCASGGSRLESTSRPPRRYHPRVRVCPLPRHVQARIDVRHAFEQTSYALTGQGPSAEESVWRVSKETNFLMMMRLGSICESSSWKKPGAAVHCQARLSRYRTRGIAEGPGLCFAWWQMRTCLEEPECVSDKVQVDKKGEVKGRMQEPRRSWRKNGSAGAAVKGCGSAKCEDSEYRPRASDARSAARLLQCARASAQSELADIEVDWAEEKEPDLIGWLKKMGKFEYYSTAATARSSGTAPASAPSSTSTPFALSPSTFPGLDNSSNVPSVRLDTTGIDYESLTLMRLRQAEQERLEPEIREREAAEGD